MSNYPDGMTKRDWEHIDREQHYRECPMHEDTEHRCDHLRPGQTLPGYIEPNYHSTGWQITVRQGFAYVKDIAIDFCPWCGEELPLVHCVCDEIAEDAKAKLKEAKGGHHAE